MLVKLQEVYFFFLVPIHEVGMMLIRTRLAIRDIIGILTTLASLLFDSRTLKNKLYAILLVACTLPVMFLEGDATATVFMAIFAVPMFFAKENWIY